MQGKRNNRRNKKNTSIISNCDAKISIINGKKGRLTVFSEFLTLKKIIPKVVDGCVIC